MTGTIVKGIAGFYYVYAVGSGIYECRARGIFRNRKLRPLAGDRVSFEITHEKDREGSITEIFPRKNELKRPAAANIDQALLLFAARTPDPNPVLIDRFLISMEMQGIPCILAMNKADLASEEEKREFALSYRDSGHPVHFLSVKDGDGLDETRELLEGSVTILAGPSGVGKSSLTNALQSTVRMETGDISRKLARGKNTTRHCELIPLPGGAFLCDTPGFSAFDLPELSKEELRNYYDEFLPFTDSCRFDGCMHVTEPGCAVREAVEDGKISLMRYRNYLSIHAALREAEQNRYR